MLDAAAELRAPLYWCQQQTHSLDTKSWRLEIRTHNTLLAAVSLLTESVDTPGLDVSVRLEGDVAQPAVHGEQLVLADLPVGPEDL